MAILDLTLATGRWISAQSLHAARTYAGLLEGVPDHALNDGLIADLTKRAAQLFGDWPVHVIEPVRSVDEQGSGRHAVERLPPCWIAVALESAPMDETMDGSAVIVVWFQEELVPVPSDRTKAQLCSLDWNAVAKDFLL